jgi:hypothetical protein
MPNSTTGEGAVKDTLPPHDTAAEAGALACVLQSDGDAAAMLDALTLDSFYDERHRTVYRTLAALRRANAPLDLVALLQRLRDKGNLADAGGFEYVTALPDQSPSPANWPTYFETLCDRATRRCALRDAAELSTLAQDTSLPAAAIADAARRLLDAHASTASNGERLTIRAPDELLGMAFDDSDRILGDRLLAKGQSLVIAGAGSIGKSRLLLQLAVAVITGRQFIGFETRGESLRWLILQAENSNRRLQSDLAALRQWAGADWPRVNERLAIHTLETDCDGFLSLDNDHAQRRIAAAIRGTAPDVVAWDSLYNFSIGDLNKDEDMAATLLAISRLSRAGNPNRAVVTLHHALTGKAGAARATGYDRSSFGRNSKVLHSWTRGQLNVAPGAADSNDVLVLTCGKCSNGREFEPFAARLNPQSMIYELAADFDLEAWEAEITGRSDREPLMTPERVQELCLSPKTRPELAHAIREDCGCARQVAYRYIKRAEQAHKIRFNERTQNYAAR